jgi:hypothetical protein
VAAAALASDWARTWVTGFNETLQLDKWRHHAYDLPLLDHSME